MHVIRGHGTGQIHLLEQATNGQMPTVTNTLVTLHIVVVVQIIPRVAVHAQEPVV